MEHDRPSGRAANQMRQVTITRKFTSHAEGSVLVAFGETKVICTASVERGVPPFMRGTGRGWVTAEYGMLPRSTGSRMEREAVRGRQGGRSVEIQRLIGRSLRAVIDFDHIGEYTIKIDCDVIQADGGTRTAAVTGGCVALIDAVRTLAGLKVEPVRELVASVSVGMVAGRALLDLDYREDSGAETDLNVVMTESGAFIEVQGTAEKNPFTREQLDSMLNLAAAGIRQLLDIQRGSLSAG